MANHSFNWYGNINKLLKTMFLLSIPVGVISIIFWNVFPMAKVVLFAFLIIVSLGIFDRLLSWSLPSYNYRRREFFALLLGIVLGWVAVSNGLLPEIIIVMS